MKKLLTLILIASSFYSNAQIDAAVEKKIDERIEASNQKEVVFDTADAVLPLEITRVSKTQYKLSIKPATSTSAGSYTPAQMAAIEQQFQTLKQEAIADRAKISQLEARITELTNKLSGLRATTTITQ